MHGRRRPPPGRHRTIRAGRDQPRRSEHVEREPRKIPLRPDLLPHPSLPGGDVSTFRQSGSQSGEGLIDPALQRLALAGRHPGQQQGEQAVLDLLAVGLSNKEIGKKLTLAESTIKTHVINILTKLGATSRTHAASEAFRLGLVTVK